jgi:hypothetical protein
LPNSRLLKKSWAQCRENVPVKTIHSTYAMGKVNPTTVTNFGAFFTFFAKSSARDR